MFKDNIVLIGMPGSGKTTIGSRLASKLGMAFADTDQIITEKEKACPREIVSIYGSQRFLDIQNELISSLDLHNHVIATGGSVVCSEKAMKNLKETGIVVYLKADIDEIEKRAAPGRKFAGKSGQSLRDIYAERKPLYEKYADITIDCSDRSVECLMAEILDRIEKYRIKPS